MHSLSQDVMAMRCTARPKILPFLFDGVCYVSMQKLRSRKYTTRQLHSSSCEGSFIINTHSAETNPLDRPSLPLGPLCPPFPPGCNASAPNPSIQEKKITHLCCSHLGSHPEDPQAKPLARKAAVLRVISTAQKIIGCPLPSLEDL